jgi:hypothetical protein
VERDTKHYCSPSATLRRPATVDSAGVAPLRVTTKLLKAQGNATENVAVLCPYSGSGQHEVSEPVVRDYPVPSIIP